MKNLKKVLALVVALTMVLGTVAFASFTDVTVEDEEFTAVSTLSSLEILNGYEDGSFKPDGDITRAEFCAVVCRALGYEAAAGATIFTDVPADHWAAGYINTCSGAGIVNGMGDGTFAPSANVTYEQAVKMLVVALGYEPMAAQKGGYPTGYMVVANTYGMTKGISVASQAAAASRGVVAQLTYNALDIPMMEQTGFGTNTEYTILDGKNGRDYKTLLTCLNVAKLEGKVVETSLYGKANVGEVAYRFTDVEGNEYLENKIAKQYDEENAYVGDYGEFTFVLAEGLDADAYFQQASVVYAKEYAKNKFEIISIIPGADSETVTILSEDIIDEDTDATVVVYEDPDNARKDIEIDLAAKVDYYVNYEVADVDDVKELVAAAEAAIDDTMASEIIITFIDNNGDGDFDVAVANAYNYDVIKDIDADAETITGKKGADLAFDFEGDEVQYIFTNKDGDAIEFADFAEGDVIAFASDAKAEKYIEIINYGANSVTGKVVGENKAKGTVVIDGTDYELAKAGVAAMSDEGVFYLTSTGKIFDADAEATASDNYAIVLAAGADNNSLSGNSYQVKLLTKENEIVIYNLRDSYYQNNKADWEFVKAFEAVEGENENTIDDIIATADERLVTFELDSNNKIKFIANFVGDDSKKIKAIGENEEFDADGEALGKANLVSSTVVFNLSVKDVDSVAVTSISTLVDEVVYGGYYVEDEETEDAACLVITAGDSAIDFNQDFAIVAGYSETKINDNSENAKIIEYYTAGDKEVKEITVSDEATFLMGEYADIDDGDIFMFTANEEGLVSDFALIYNYTDAGFEAVEVPEATAARLAKDEIEFKVAYITDINSDLAAGTKLYTADEEFAPIIRSTTNKYSIEAVRNGIEINVGTWKVAKKVTAMKDGDTAANFFAMKLVDGKAADVVVIADKIELK